MSLSELELQVKEHMERTGDTQEETANQLGVSKLKVSTCVKSLKEKGEWNQELIKKKQNLKRKREKRVNDKAKIKKSQPQTEAYKYVLNLLATKYLDYDARNSKTFDTSISQQLSIISKQYSDTVILRAVKMSEDGINYACKNKTFTNHRNKVMYVFAIIKSQLKKAQEEENKHNKIQQSKENMINIEHNKEFEEKNIVKRKDLSSLIDDDL